MLSKKNYTAFARIINRFESRILFRHGTDKHDDVEFLIAELSAYFKQDNSDFDKEKFRHACFSNEID